MGFPRLEGAAIPFSRGSSQTRAQTHISCIGGGFFTAEPVGKPPYSIQISRLLGMELLEKGLVD